MRTVADQFIDILAAAGVKRIYGIVGDSLNGLTDAIRRHGRIEWVHVHHEEVAAFAAGAAAHLTGELAVCAGSCWPGNLHLINGPFESQRSRQRLAAMLNAESCGTILCGSGCAGAHDELLKLGERLKAPMVHAMRGKEHVEWDNPYDVGMTGLIGFSSGYYAMLDCDVLLMLGTDFPYRQFYPSGGGVRIPPVHNRPEEIRRRPAVALAL